MKLTQKNDSKRTPLVELAHRMGTRPQEVQSIINQNHATKIDAIAAALAAIGKHLDMRVAP